MFEKIKERIVIKKINKIEYIYSLNKLWDNYKINIQGDSTIFISFVEKCLQLNHYPSDNIFQETFNKNYIHMDDSLLYKIIDSSRFCSLLINSYIYPNLSKDLRLKLLNYYGNYNYNFDFSDLIDIQDIIETYKNNENLIPLLKERLENASTQELIQYINLDENLVLEISFDKIISIINSLNLSNDTLFRLFEKDNNLLKHLNINHSLLLQILKEHPNKTNSILSNISLNDTLKIYNLDKEYFNNLFLEHPEFIKDNITLQNYILMNNKEFIKKQMSGFFKYNNTQSLNFGYDFFLDNRSFNDILLNFGSKKFIEFLKFYPLFGASEKYFGAGDREYTVYDERQMYNNKHYILRKNSSIDDICSLIEIDINYLFNIYNFDENEKGYILNTEETNFLKQNILSLLLLKLKKDNLDDKYELLISSIDKIFENIKEEELLSYSNGGNDVGYQSFKIKKYELIKLLFNSDILSHNDIQDINNYINSYYENSRDNKELFYKIIENAYGDKALQIIKSRPGLNPLTITSFEIFRPCIINNFSEGFIHDLLSYNIKGFTNFLMISKNEEELLLFIDYYKCLSKIYGENVMTMEKSFLNFYYYKDLIKSLQNIDLSEEEQQNLVAVLSGNLNYHNINTYDDLKKYNKTANQELLKLLKECKNIDEYKNILCNDLFGIDYEIIETSYKFVIDNINESYYTSDFISSLSESEKNIMEFLKFICNYEITLDKLQVFVNNVIDSQNIRNSISCISLLNKIRVKEIEEINKTLLNKEKLEELVEHKSLIKEEFDGVPIYIYSPDNDKLKKKLISKVLRHNTILGVSEIYNLEPDNGTSTICTWYGHSCEFSRINFAQIPLDTQIVASSPIDGQTSKLAKSVHAKGIKNNMSYGSHGICNDDIDNSAEVSFYRRHRDHKNITNENHGGLIVPNCFDYLSLDTIDQAKNCNGIIICSYDDYSKFIEGLNNEKEVKGL